jgi:hypothetical protein
MNAVTKRIQRKLLLGVGALAISLAVLAPAAGAATIGPFAFRADSFTKPHPALQQEMNGFCVPGAFQCIINDQDSWVQAIEDAPEEIQAGGHPDLTTHFRFAVTHENEFEPWLEGGHPNSITTDAPAGSIGNPLAVPRCEMADFNLTAFGACPPESQVGVTVSALSFAGFENFNFYTPISSLVPSPGQPAQLGFKSFSYTIMLYTVVRSESDYGLRLTAEGIPMGLAEYMGSTVTLWGVPHDPVHDPHRFNDTGSELGGHIEGTPRPFLSAPTNCSTGPITLRQEARSWEHPDEPAKNTSTSPEPTGCDKVPFEPSVSARPTTNVADSPSGLEVDVSTPQHEGCEQIVPAPPANESQFDCGIATSHLKDTTLTLPAGLTINPASANGLDGCSTQEIGLTTPLGVTPQQFTKAVPSCPESSRIAGVEIDTPLLDAPMPGSVYLADPYDNPFKSLLAIYIVANDEERGLIVKLAGEVKADPVTGQLSTVVTNAPQLPFSHFLLHFKQGPHATLRTPSTCATYTTNASLTPYSAPDSPVPTTDEWQISQGPGGSCDQPNAPAMDAGTVSPSAASYSPFVVHLRRDDGTQNFKAVSISPPPGLVAKLAGVAQCSDAALAAAAAKSGAEEKASPSCPAASQIGTVSAGAGAGPAPYYAPGKAYLTGPYKGAPLSIAIVTPATAGPFDLGTIVVRTALYIDSKTARITAVSDDIPQILQGIPLDIRTVDLSIDRNQFTETGTSCDPSSVEGTLTSALGQIASLQSRFQLAECSSLAFKPKLSLRLKGGTTRGKHPALTATFTPRPGDANLKAISVALPHSEFLDQAHIGTVCTRVQFAAEQCPAASVYGKVTATTPLFDFPLKGNVYLRSSDNELPDLVPDLRGPAQLPVKFEAAGRTDSVGGGIRNSFEFVPDAPITKLVLELKAGKKGLLQNSTNICSDDFRAAVHYTAHNGKTQEGHPELRNSKCAKAKKRGGKGHAHKRSAAR